MFEISLDGSILSQVPAIQSTINAETTGWLEDMADWIRNDLKQRVPMKSGQLKNSIRSQVQRTTAGGEATFLSAFYGPYIDQGTGSYGGKGPYVIRARNARALHFINSQGKEVFAYSVIHPGVKPRYFTLKTLDAAKIQADLLAEEIGGRVFRAVIS